MLLRQSKPEYIGFQKAIRGYHSMNAHSISQVESTNPRHCRTVAGEQTATSFIPEADTIWRRRQASQAAARGDYQGAIDILSQLIQSNPTSASDYNNRGLIYFQSGQLDQAIADYNRALVLNPNLASAYNNRANYYAARGKLKSALINYDKAIDLNPLHQRAWINRGITFRDLGLYELAIENFDYALRLGRLQAQIWAERGRTYHLMGEWNAAVADYRRALAQLMGETATPDADSPLQTRVQTWLAQLLPPLSA